MVYTWAFIYGLWSQYDLSQKEKLLFQVFGSAIVKIVGCQKEQIYSSLSFFEVSLASTNDTVVAAILAWAGSVINWLIFLYQHNRDHDNVYEKGISPQETWGVKAFIKCKLLARPFVISQFKYAVVLFMFLSTIMCNLQKLEMHS